MLLNIPLSYKIRLKQVRPTNKIHPYIHFSEYFLYFCRNIALIWGLRNADGVFSKLLIDSQK